MKIKRWKGFWAINASHNEAKLTCIELNVQTLCPPRAAAWPAKALHGGSRSTKGVVGGFFALNTLLAFGHGCDHPSYVGWNLRFCQQRGKA
jgi:hypothetical protein